jgi:hypothetical protein
MGKENQDYLMEQSLRRLDPELHRRFSDMVLAVQGLLYRFRNRFPEFTDHSALHSMSVIELSNRLIGPEQLEQLNADALYVMLTSCYLHDVGMGISEEDYLEFSKEIDFGDFASRHPDADMSTTIRAFHQEYSALLIRKYASFLEIPTSAHVFAIMQVSRGHRKTDLFDEEQFPPEYTVPNGNPLYLPYLAAVIRLADEIDVMASRNPLLLYDQEEFHDPLEIAYHKRHQSVRDLRITKDALIMRVVHIDPETDQMVWDLRQKMEETLLTCRRAAKSGSPFRISQKEVLIEEYKDI